MKNHHTHLVYFFLQQEELEKTTVIAITEPFPIIKEKDQEKIAQEVDNTNSVLCQKKKPFSGF